MAGQNSIQSNSELISTELILKKKIWLSSFAIFFCDPNSLNLFCIWIFPNLIHWIYFGRKIWNPNLKGRSLLRNYQLEDTRQQIIQTLGLPWESESWHYRRYHLYQLQTLRYSWLWHPALGFWCMSRWLQWTYNKFFQAGTLCCNLKIWLNQWNTTNSDLI